MTFGANLSLALVLVATAVCCAGAVPLGDVGVARPEKAAPAKPQLHCRIYFGCAPVARPPAGMAAE